MKLTQIMNENQENRPLSNEVKKHFLEIVSTYNKYQEMMDRKSDLATVAETLGGITEAARTLAIHEGDDWFDKQTIKRNMSELDKLGKEFDKCAKEATSLDQRLGGLYEDMGHILSRYYKMGEITEEQMKERLGMNESVGCGCGGTTEGGCGCGTHTHESVNESKKLEKDVYKALNILNNLASILWQKKDKRNVVIGKAIDTIERTISKRELFDLEESVNESLEFVVNTYRDGKSYIGYYDSRNNSLDRPKFIPKPYGNTKDAIKVAKSLAKKNKGKYIDDFMVLTSHPDNYAKKGDIKESVNESASKEAMGIAALTGTRGSAVQNFIDKNRINSKKLFRALKSANLQGRMNFASALSGKPGNPNEKLTIKLFGETVNEEKPGLWANIRAKQKRGEKPAHKNSQAHKDAVKAGKKINNEAKFGYKDSTASYINKHKDEYKVAEKMNNGNEKKFYDMLQQMEEKVGHGKTMLFISNALRGYGVDMFKDPKIKNPQDAQEALFLLSK